MPLTRGCGQQDQDLVDDQEGGAEHAKRNVAALWSARLLRDVTNYAFYKDATVQVAPPDPNGSGAAVPCGDHTAALCVP